MTSASPRTSRTVLTGAVVLPDRVVGDGAVAVAEGTIAYAGERASLPDDWAEVAEPDGWQAGLTLLPGLVDIHCHGGNGGEFGPDAGGSHRAARHHHGQGTTTVVGSLVSAPAAVLVAGARTLGDLVRSGELAGIHLEGPFLSMVRCGAQNPAALVDADVALVEALGEAAGEGAFAQMTWAPERPGGQTVPTALASVGALAALGHTDADYATATRALAGAAAGVRGGVPLATHVFNGMPPLLSRSPGPVGAAIAAAGRREAVLEVIADGVHLDAGTVRMLFDTVGPGQVALVSDAMAASGLPDGAYSLGGLDVAVSGRAARLRDNGTLAGGVSTLLEQVRWLVDDLGVPLVDAVTAASATPARALALPRVGSLAPGQHADVVVVDDRLQLRQVLRRGTWL
ncbi:N-acetylglucosamine 6-phosphate deacetylase [Pedococcus dokdonensis]|uniref:N-acetylglucosamine 6-phosphate deacetylase n=1 Tax=Pedococcus dokdonensis TaxID=443156 RepID=A0A1H0LGQ9_9MICO|nr:amidohydrolase family protein [Pedococcus dokdonensis]SDO67236.1 N-acetylglucosamine 6-phosphate deacetylase [Pedococcus dokdonensis]